MLDDACLVLLVGSNISAVPGWLHRHGARGDGPRLIVAHPSDLADDVAVACDEFPGVHRLPLADAGDPEATLAAIVAAVPTTHFTITTLEPPTPDLLDGLAATLVTARRPVAAVTSHLPAPVLLWHRTTPVHLVTAYIDRVLAQHADLPPAVSDYLGSLALQAALVTVEWLDPRPGAVDMALRINLAGHRFADRPSWQFRVAVTAPHAGDVTGSDPVGLVERIDASGTSRWEWLVARVPLSGVPTGDYRIELSLNSPHESLWMTRAARPSNGSLANARTVRLAASSTGARTVRYYLHTPDHGRETRLRVGHGSGPLAELVWRARITAADLRYILRGDGGRRMRALRLLKLLTTPLFLGREIWLLGERADEAQDNGMHLFRHLRTHHPRRHVYYVLSRSSPQYPELRRLGHVVPHSSRRHQLLMLHAAVVANAHSTHHMLPRHWNRKAFLRRLAWRIGALQVFLQHGVHLSPEAVKRGTTGYDVILTSARGESRALRAVSGYDAQIAEVGMPRFDHLTPTPPSRTILMLPTWRRYLRSHARALSGTDQDHYDGSTYERFMTGLLNSARLQTMLESFDYRLVLVPHHNVAEHLTDAATAGDRITVVAATGTALQDMVRRCDVFVTDHSSVHFDAAYLGTPVIYARFDREEFESRHAAPSWFDFERDGFGPVATTVEGTLDELDALLARGCTPDPRFAGRATESFAHRDQGNSRRVVATIDRRLRKISTMRGGS